MTKCRECNHKECIGRHWYCTHPNQKYIYDYHNKHHMAKFPPYLGISKTGSYLCPVKTAPAWCPFKAKEGSENT